MKTLHVQNHGWTRLDATSTCTPVRKVGSRRPRRPFGFVSSLKMGGRQIAESRLELDNLRILEADPLVLAYYPQPTTMQLKTGDASRRYTPDVLVRRHDGSLVIEEVKFREEADDPAMRGFHEQVARECQAKGYEFVVKTEDDIRGGPRLQNALLLLSHRSTELSTDFLRCLAEALGERLAWTLEELRQALGLERWNCSSMLNAIRCGHAVIDIALPLEPGSTVRSPMEVPRQVSLKGLV